MARLRGAWVGVGFRFRYRRSVLEPGEVDPTEIGQQVARSVVFGQRDLLLVRVEDLGVEAEAPQFLDEGLVGLDASEDVVRLDGEQLLQDVRGAVRLERPDLHLAEALSAELGLATQRLLRDEAVWAGRARVDLVL